MKIEKAQFGISGDRVALSVPFAKVDKENRIVSGFATLDSPDTQDDVVLAEASVEAFSNFRGNLRLMHQPIPAGKVVNFREEEFYDTKTEKFYRGIHVDTYVSKGAPEVWEMVLDGTLTGFSIGGNILDAETQFVKDAGDGGRHIRFIKKYELVELSLVDSPANPLANILSVTKAAGGETILKGMATELEIENVFYCEADSIAKATTENAANCAACGNEMSNIGWFEVDGNRTEKVRELVQKVITTADFKNSTEDEGGAEMAEENKEDVEVVVDNATAEDLEEAVEEVKEVEPEDGAEQTVDGDVDEQAADVEEVETDETDFEKMLGDVRADVAKSAESTTAAINELKAQLEKVNSDFTAQFSELVQNHNELSEKFSGLRSELSNVEKRMESVEGETAIKKSGDLGGSTEGTTTKSSSKWGGFFSVDNL